MIVTYLKLTNLRAIKAAEFRFPPIPGFNLIVGVNGVGKTSVLDALSVCLSGVVKSANKLRGQVKSFSDDDIRIGADSLTVECGVQMDQMDQQEYSYLVHKPREMSVPQKKKAGLPREQVHETPERRQFIGDAPPTVSGDERDGRPLALFFSTNRAVPSERAPRKGVAAGGIEAAFADAFLDRELRLGEIGDWLKVQKSLCNEPVLAACEDAVKSFLPGYANLRLGDKGRPQLWIDRDSTTIPVRQLSDGERGILALVLDLTRRLAQANPNLTDPVSQAEAVVLIDEIDLHLHPKWQREVRKKLCSTFPNIQFIATTHSPFVIQDLRPGELINLDPKESVEYADKSIEDIAENVMGVELPQKSKRYLDMMDAAEEYFRLLRNASGNPGKLAEAEKRLNELSMPFSDDPAFQALLKLERETMIGRGDYATG